MVHWSIHGLQHAKTPPSERVKPRWTRQLWEGKLGLLMATEQSVCIPVCTCVTDIGVSRQKRRSQPVSQSHLYVLDLVRRGAVSAYECVQAEMISIINHRKCLCERVRYKTPGDTHIQLRQKFGFIICFACLPPSPPSWERVACVGWDSVEN